MNLWRVLLVLGAGAFLIAAGGAVRAHRAEQGGFGSRNVARHLQEGASPHATQPDTSHGHGLTGALPYAVGGVDDVVFEDPQRNKDLHVKVFYPQAQGPFPVILFSHGYGGSKDSYRVLTHYWAEHGYVTLQPNHDDAYALRKALLRGWRLRRQMEKTLNDPAAWDQRVGDMVFLLGALSDLHRRVPQLAGKLDLKHVGVGGHSFGAFTAMLVAGATVDVPNGPRHKSYADPRPRAFLLLSPQGSGSRGLTAHSWKEVTRPLMVMTGSRDRGAEGEGPTWREDPFKLSPPGNKYLVFITGANHLTFAGLPTPFGRSKKKIEAVQAASLAFWNAYLKGDAPAKAWLDSGSIHQVCAAAELEHR